MFLSLTFTVKAHIKENTEKSCKTVLTDRTMQLNPRTEVL